jgi:hypothetical protein
MERIERLIGPQLKFAAVVAATLASVASFAFVVVIYASASGELEVALGHVSSAVAAAAGPAALAASAKARPG